MSFSSFADVMRNHARDENDSQGGRILLQDNVGNDVLVTENGDALFGNLISKSLTIDNTPSIPLLSLKTGEKEWKIETSTNNLNIHKIAFKIDDFPIQGERFSIDSLGIITGDVLNVNSIGGVITESSQPNIRSVGILDTLSIKNQGSGYCVLVERTAGIDPNPICIDSSGVLGLGVQSPLARLDVLGNAIITNSTSSPALYIKQHW